MKPISYTAFFITILLASFIHLPAQVSPVEQDDLSRAGKWYFIPEANVWFGNYTSIEVSPQIAYHFTDRLSVGTGIHYNFFREVETYATAGYSTHLYGPRLFSRFAILTNAEEWLPIYLFSDLFVHAEYQMINLESEYFSPTNIDGGRFWTEQFYMGVGFTQKISQFSSYSLVVLWDINQSLYSAFGNPIYRVGMNLYF